MKLLRSLFGPRKQQRQLEASLSDAVVRWNEVQSPDLSAPLEAQQWLVVDVETTGLNVRQDQLLAIGAVMVDGGSIGLDQSFEVVIKQTTASLHDNILIHRIGGNEQLAGVDAAASLALFLDYAKKLPCVAFHAPFDEAMLKRAFSEHLGIDFSVPFIDLALLAPALVRAAPTTLESLDDWIDYFGIVISARHRAVADAFGTAQLFQVLLTHAASTKALTADALFKLEREQRWLAKMSRK